MKTWARSLVVPSLGFLLAYLVGCSSNGGGGGSSTVVRVSTEVKGILEATCSGCHVPLPAYHIGELDSDQCGLCHIPYSQHADTIPRCTACHPTPDVTHFYLRDDDNQYVLKADAETDCADCHLDGGGPQTGAGRPALDTDEAIIAAARNGTLRSWIQPGGFMAKYLTDSEVTTITNWIDGTFGDRELGYDPYLDATWIDSDFDINGLGDNPLWSLASEHVIKLEPTIYTATSQIKIKALYSDQYLYIRTEHPDATLSMTRSGSWILDAGEWRHPFATTENDKQSEDRVAFLWNISIPDYKQRFGCAIKCHGNVPGSSEFADLTDSTGDIWHNKAARALGVLGGTVRSPLVIETGREEFEAIAGSATLQGFADDKWLIWYMDLDDGYDTEDSGRRGDEGQSPYAHNRNGDKSAPVWIETAPTDWVDAMTLTQAEIDAAEVVPADPAAEGYDPGAVEAAWANYEALDAVVPERILRVPQGSRGDVINSASWTDGVWVNEYRRALLTGHPADDVQFDLDTATEYEYSITVFDNCGRGEIPPGHTTYGEGQYQILRFLR